MEFVVMRLGRFRFSAWRAARRFAEAQDGAVAIILALALLPTILLGGVAVDMRRISSSRTELQAAADSAALAAVDALRQGGNAELAATNYVKAAFEGRAVQPTVSTTRSNATTVSVQLSFPVPMTIMKIARFNTVPITVSATATYGPGSDPTTPVRAAEIVLAFDTTGSMSQGGRLDAAKSAAKTLIRKVMNLPDGSPDLAVRVGLVPFAQYVNVGLQYRNASWLTDTQDVYTPAGRSCSTQMTQSDPGPIEHVNRTCWTSDEQSYDCGYDVQTRINWRNPQEVCTDYPEKSVKWHGCVGSVNGFYFQGAGIPIYNFDEHVEVFPSGPYNVDKTSGMMPYEDIECTSPLVRLTQNQSELNSAIDALTPKGFTYIAPAVLWGWRLVTRGQPFDDAARSGDSTKSLVLMTDGANTRSPYYPNHNGTYPEEADTKTRAVCTNAKAAGIKIYTIGFMAPDAVKPLLKECASTPANYYDAPSIPELQRAYNDIGARMTALRLIK